MAKKLQATQPEPVNTVCTVDNNCIRHFTVSLKPSGSQNKQ